MRITTGMMMNTSKNNINTNKVRVDRLYTQMSTQKKIMKPSEDPIIAVRSLRLRNNISEINQYYEKNIPDAQSWLEVTESAMGKMRDILKDMYQSYTQGANGNLSASQRTDILEHLDALSKEFYDEGNASYAGRSVFTGHRTDMSYTFKNADSTASYNISETFEIKDITAKTHISNSVSIDFSNLTPISEAELPQTNQVQAYTLNYSEMSEIKSLSFVDTDGTTVTIPVKTASIASDKDAAYLNPDADGVNYIPETGELVFGKDIEKKLKSLDDSTVITANYDKTGFAEGEVLPMMYYDCVDLNTGVEHKKEVQDIKYQVGFNQTIKVNTEARDVLDLNIQKEVNDLRNAITDVTNTEDKLANLKKMLGDDRYNDTEKKAIQTMYDATEKELDLKKDKMQKLFNAGVGSFQEYEDDVNLQITDEGNRSSRLKMIKSRMSQQQTNFKELLTQNEDRELSDIILDLTSAMTSYNAALQAVGNISQLSLLNYI